MDVLIDEWKIQARGILSKFGYDVKWLAQADAESTSKV